MNDIKPHHALTIVGWIMPATGLLLWLNHALATAPKPVISDTQPAITVSESEYGELLTSTGEIWGKVKLWGYKDNPVVEPNIDLDSVEKAREKGHRVILLESHDVPPIPGWRLEEGNPDPIRNTPDFAAKYPEIFKDSIKPR